MSEIIKTHLASPIGYITLNRPEKRNALTVEMFEGIAESISKLDLSNEVKYIVIKGVKEPKPIFSAGIDLKNISTVILSKSPNEMPEFFLHLQNCINSIEKCKKPVISVIEGVCLGAALEIALACDFRISTPDCSIGLLETKFGMIPDLGGTARLVKMVGRNRAKKIILTSEVFNAEVLSEWGVVDYLASDVSAKLSELIDKMEGNSYSAITTAKKLIHDIETLNLSKGLDLEREAQLKLFASGEIQNRITEYFKMR